MSAIILRHIKQDDNAAVAKLIRGVFENFGIKRPGTVYFDPTTDHLSDVFQTEGSVMWIALLDDKIVGCAGIYPTEGLPEGYCEFVKYYVASEYRGKGIGKLLFDKCMEAARELGYTNMYLESMPEFSNAIGIYERLGFTKLSAPLGNSGHFGCSIWMHLTFT